MTAGRGAVGVELMSGAKAFDITPFVRSARWCESLLEGGLSWEFSVATEQWSEWERALIGRDTPSRKLRFKNVEGDTSQTTETATPWRTIVVDGSAHAVKGTTMHLRLWGADRRLELAQLARCRAWPATRISEIVERVANDYGLVARAQETPGRHDRIQARESDWTYLKRLSYLAASASGRGDVFLWVDEDTLNLGAPELTRPSVRRHDLSEVENRVDGLDIRFNGRAIDRAGGATARGVGYDWDAQEALVFTMDPGAAATHPALAGRVPRAQGGGLRSFPIFKDSKGSVEEETRALWGRYAPRYFQVELRTRPDLTLRPGSVIEVSASQGERQETPYFGRFLVLEVTHALTNGKMTTTAACARREAFVGAEEATGAAASNLGTSDRDRFGQSAQERTLARVEVIS